MGNYGIVSSGYNEKPVLADIVRWNDNIKRHTLYTVCDGLQDPWGLVKGTRPTITGPVATLGGAAVAFDAIVGAQTSSQLFDWVAVSYPASYINLLPQINDTWQPKSLGISQIMTWGATELKTLISSTPGTFALVGTGIGAMVCSAILQEMQSGTLTSRKDDCIGAVMFGNPCRQEGVTYPGGIDPGGAGIMPQSAAGIKGMIRNTDTPSWWWEMALIDDPIVTCPIDVSGQAVNVVADELIKAKGGKDLLTQLAKTIPTLKKNGSIWPLVAARLTNAAGVTDGLAWASRVFSVNPNPHTLYSFTPVVVPPSTPGLTSTSTSLDLAIAYINQRGTAIQPR
jgi:hypothetical protein